MNKKVDYNDYGEVAERLSLKVETMRSLFLKSGNKCAFPDCSNPIYDGNGLVGERCHIEDALPGCRWNSSRTNEQNRQESNIVLFCRNHHVLTNDPNEYPAQRLREMKAIHENSVSKAEKEHLSPEKLADFHVTKKLFMQIHVDAVGEYIDAARSNLVIGKFLIFADLFRDYFTAPFAMFHDEKLEERFQSFYNTWDRLTEIGVIEGKDTSHPMVDRVRVNPKNRIESQETVEEHQYWADETDLVFRELLKYVHSKFPAFDFNQTNSYAWSQYLETHGD
ncbi:hypothetical protein N9Y42_01710 [Mariniblastus sp.]|nr:hypothetical protein [Mariniblastus sp.]